MTQNDRPQEESVSLQCFLAECSIDLPLAKQGGTYLPPVCQLLGSISRDSGPGRWRGRKGTVPTAKPENLN